LFNTYFFAFFEALLVDFFGAFSSACVSQSSVSQGSSSQTSSTTGAATGSATGAAATGAGAATTPAALARRAALLFLLRRGLAIYNILLEMNFAGKRQKTSYYK
jgi:hypothetical protein